VRVGDLQYAKSHGPLKQTHPAVAAVSAELPAARAVPFPGQQQTTRFSEHGDCAVIRH